MRRPAWAAAGTFHAAWAALEHDVTLVKTFPTSAMGQEGARQKGAALSALNMAALLTMQSARVVSVSREQVVALPRMDWADVRSYFEHARLPFSSVYLSLANAPLALFGEQVLAGAVLSEGDDATRLSVMPVGPVTSPHASRAGRLGIAGSIIRQADGRVEVASNVGGFGTMSTEGLTEEEVRTGIFYDLLERVVSVLYFLESVNVDLAEAPLSPKQRKRELKKGRQIALTVQVRPPKSKSVGRNGKANYSHRFEVAGHYMHFPEGTRVGDADPNKLSFVPGRGFVRKVWCPPHVKGPADKPLIPKVRVVQELHG